MIALAGFVFVAVGVVISWFIVAQQFGGESAVLRALLSAALLFVSMLAGGLFTAVGMLEARKEDV